MYIYMSENSLIVRQKYISKLFDKVESLQEGIQLLEKVDSKIFKKNMSRTIQAGGAPVTDNGISIKGLESEALVTRLKLEQQKGVIEKARLTIDTLNKGLDGVRNSLEQLHRLMQDVNDNIKIDPLGDAQLPDLSSYGKQTLYNAFKNIPYADMVKVTSDNTETLYALLEKAPATFTQKLTGDKGISNADYDKLLARLHGASAPKYNNGALVAVPGPDGSAPAPGSAPGSAPGPDGAAPKPNPPAPYIPNKVPGGLSNYITPKVPGATNTNLGQCAQKFPDVYEALTNNNAYDENTLKPSSNLSELGIDVANKTLLGHSINQVLASCHPDRNQNDANIGKVTRRIMKIREIINEAPAQSGGFFSSFFMPKNIENSVTSSEMPFTAQNLYSETSNY